MTISPPRLATAIEQAASAIVVVSVTFIASVKLDMHHE